MINRSSKFTRLTVLIAVTSLLLGCKGDGLASVTGKITVDGKAIEGLEIIFEPQFAGGAPSIGFTDASGNYEAMFTANKKGVAVGKHIVRISGTQYGEGTTTQLAAIPPQYGPESTQEVEIVSGKNTVDLDVKSR